MVLMVMVPPALPSGHKMDPCGLIAYVLIAEPAHGPLLLIYGSLLLTHAGTEIMSWFESQRKVERIAWAQFAGFLVSALCIGVGLWVQAPLWFFALTYNIECWFALVMVIVVTSMKKL